MALQSRQESGIRAAPAVKYVAELKGSREVTLVGTADLDFWRAHLEGQGLPPHSSNGRAQLSLSSVESRWLGARFRELVLAVCVSHRGDGSSNDGQYLAAAYNSSRVLAFLERLVFRTPYRHGVIEVKLDAPAGSRAPGRPGHGPSRGVVRAGAGGEDAEVWQGPIFLPRRKGGPGEHFFARIGGLTEVYPFSAAADVLTLRPSARHPVVQWLIDSRFVGTEWHVRRDAVHARSKTYPGGASQTCP